MAGRNDYEEKKQARIDRLEARSEKAQKESSRLYGESKKMLDVIPLGQPILVDHYSAKSDRNYRNRAFNKMDKSVAEQHKANHYANKAEAAANNTAISSDDPKAIEKLEAKLSGLTQEQEEMKRINAYYRKHKTCKGCEGISEEYAAKLDATMEKAYSWETAPFASYSLSNNNAEIRRLRERIELLKREEKREDKTEERADGIVVKQNTEINRLQIIFPGKPDEATRKLLKQYGFRWAPSEGAWQRQLNNNAVYSAKRALEKIDSGIVAPKLTAPERER